MKERSLHFLFSRLVILAAPLAAQTGCGGTTAVHSGGVAPESGGIGGVAAGGAAGMGGAAAGAGTGGAATGGSAPGGAGTGGSSACVIPSNPGADCTVRRSGMIPRSCVPGDLTSVECQAICGNTATGPCQNVGETDTTITISCAPSCVAGRRPASFIDVPNFGTGLGAYFAQAAQLEGASVAAFRGLRAELHGFGAPRPVLRALSRAARDEQRHTRATSALARRFGARSLPARVAPIPKRSLEAIALENVAEGCVRELYGALVATFQARTAQDLQVRSAMARIAREETRHAALSLSLQRWLERRLDRSAVARVAAARRVAAHRLRLEIAHQPELACAEQAGLPTVHQAQWLFDSLSATWFGQEASVQLTEAQAIALTES